MLEALSGNQVMHNLNNDSWVRHYATPTPFVGGVNNTTTILDGYTSIGTEFMVQ